MTQQSFDTGMALRLASLFTDGFDNILLIVKDLLRIEGECYRQCHGEKVIVNT